ncbi:MAG: hypothetical protein SVT56_03115 [Chloroflexota bacterium]|jgi:hypothetical protein|nr:hypothetical protein [Chloroflexota bacterium]
MKKRQRLLLLISAISLFLLSGCVNLVQEMTVREDGSGVVRFALGVEDQYYEQVQEEIPEGYALENLLATLMQEELVTDVTQETYEQDGWTWDSVQLEIADITALFEEERRIGPLRITLDEEEGEFTFTQTLDLTNTNFSIPGINLMDLTDAGYTVRLTAPHILDTNGVQTLAGESVWELSPADLTQEGEGMTLRAEYSLEPYEGIFIPWDTFFDAIVFGWLALGVLSVLVVIIVNTTGRWKRGRKRVR